jgi:hypothetical protein
VPQQLQPAGRDASTAAGEAPQQQQRQQQQQQLPLHISISRTLPIRATQRDSVRAALAQQLRPHSRAFSVALQGLVALRNEGGTRTFVGIKVAAGHKQVCVGVGLGTVERTRRPSLLQAHVRVVRACGAMCRACR